MRTQKAKGWRVVFCKPGAPDRIVLMDKCLSEAEAVRNAFFKVPKLYRFSRCEKLGNP